MFDHRKEKSGVCEIRCCYHNRSFQFSWVFIVLVIKTLYSIK